MDRILIVDDNPINVDILRRLLRKDYDLATAASGEECLAIVPTFKPQLVLLDIMMPGMDGYEACRRIKSSAIGEFVQVILVSGKGSIAERVKGYEAQADDYIVKPFDHEELLSKVRVQFRLWDAQRQLTIAKDQLEMYAGELEEIVSIRTKQLTATQDMAVFALAHVADSRDPETGEHLQRMRRYAQMIAEELADNGPYADHRGSAISRGSLSLQSVARHRQGRCARFDPAKAGAADGRRIRGDEEACGRRRPNAGNGSRPDRARHVHGHGSRYRPLSPRASSTARVIVRGCGASKYRSRHESSPWPTSTTL